VPGLSDAYARGARIVGRRIAGEYVLVPLVTHAPTSTRSST
jgi:hypothetical protein